MTDPALLLRRRQLAEALVNHSGRQFFARFTLQQLAMFLMRDGFGLTQRRSAICRFGWRNGSRWKAA
jgi:hypothetical protein